MTGRRLSPEQQARRWDIIHRVAVVFAEALHSDPLRRRRAMRRRAYRMGWWRR